jgi:DNA-binding HxlR family transcriptional regulator
MPDLSADPLALYRQLVARLRQTLAHLDALRAEQQRGVVTPEEADICLQALAADLQPIVDALRAWHQAAHPEDPQL